MLSLDISTDKSPHRSERRHTFTPDCVPEADAHELTYGDPKRGTRWIENVTCTARSGARNERLCLRGQKIRLITLCLRDRGRAHTLARSLMPRWSACPRSPPLKSEGCCVRPLGTRPRPDGAGARTERQAASNDTVPSLVRARRQACQLVRVASTARKTVSFTSSVSVCLKSRRSARAVSPEQGPGQPDPVLRSRGAGRNAVTSRKRR